VGLYVLWIRDLKRICMVKLLLYT